MNFEGDLVHSYFVSFNVSSDYESMNPIGVLRFPINWTKVLSVFDLWSHFVNQNRREFLRVLACPWSGDSDWKIVYLATTPNGDKGQTSSRDTDKKHHWKGLG